MVKVYDMSLEQRINALAALGDEILSMNNEAFQSLASQARNENPWFTEQNVRMAMNGISKFLSLPVLNEWMSRYPVPTASKTIGLVCAGNIPLVGFHDLLCVLITGHTALIKLSSKDHALMRYMITQLTAIEPAFTEKIKIADQLKNFDAVIATGSDNSARYFDYYFSRYPHIIRKNRTSVAILSGDERENELIALGSDVFSYFGLGCRNVSKIYIPVGYSLDRLFQAWEPYADIIHHHKYCNNYDYQKSILLMNRSPFLDNGFVMLEESSKLVSPISIVYYESYKDQDDLKSTLDHAKEKIQCMVGNHAYANVPFGAAQFPAVDDYADNMDTLQFLVNL